MSANETHPRLRTLDMTYIALFAVLMAVCSWISIPAAVPFALQTFAVFFAVMALGGKRGTLALTVYLLMGAVGLPVFAGFKGGLGSLLGATGGYILGFLTTALIFWAAERFIGTSLPVAIAACVVGLISCYAFGTIWFVQVYTANVKPIGLSAALGMCVIPYIIPDLAKLALAVTLASRLKKHLH